MARKKLKWKFPFLLYLLLLSVFVKSLPVNRKVQEIPVVTTTDSFIHENSHYPEVGDLTNDNHFVKKETVQLIEAEIKNSEVVLNKNVTQNIQKNTTKAVSSLQRINLRPGLTVKSYDILLTINGDSFDGLALIQVDVLDGTRDIPIIFHVEDLTVSQVEYGAFNPTGVGFFVDDGKLEIITDANRASYTFRITYSGKLQENGFGLYRGRSNGE